MQINLSSEADIPGIMQFLEEHWVSGHPMAVSRTLMDFQHRGQNDYGFVLARHDNAIIGVLGFISAASYDPALSKRDTLWLTTWKVRDDAGASGVGIMLLAALRESVPYYAMGALGLNPDTEPLFRALNFQTGILAHYAVLDPNRKEFHLAKVPADIHASLRRPVAGQGRLAPLSREDLLGLTEADLNLGIRASQIPVKSPTFFANRYLDHPFYRYDVRAIGTKGHCRGLLTVRQMVHNGHRALRLVDLYCDDEALVEVADGFVSLLEEYDAEYLQLYATGINETALSAAGFHKINETNSLRIPLHYDPFDPSNKVRYFALSASTADLIDNAVLVTGDGDQDRPNRLPVKGTE